MLFADVIVDISLGNLDKTYQYRVPDELAGEISSGSLVRVPFGKGNREVKGYVISISSIPQFEIDKIKPISGIETGSIPIEGKMIALAYKIHENCGGTMNDALHTVLPVRKKVKQEVVRYVSLAVAKEEAEELVLSIREKKNQRAKLRLLEALLEMQVLSQEIITNKLNVSRSTIETLEKQGIIKYENEVRYRSSLGERKQTGIKNTLNEEQRRIADDIERRYSEGKSEVYLIHGVTGSGKTEIYLEVIEKVIAEGKQAIMLIPEIALTYQTVVRFYERFGDRIAIMHSRLSQGEKYDQTEKAKRGEIDVMIGPRSALFVPFKKLGLIVVDEEHENGYKSDQAPKYHARDAAVWRAELEGASVILGSATPSLEAYTKALAGEYILYRLSKRAKEAELPSVEIVDLRNEFINKNKSALSMKLKEKIADRLQKRQQIMLFLNRRGYAGFVSCRKCGYVMKCPHCDVSLTSHKNGMLMCHYCGYTLPFPEKCPECDSKYIAAFGTGTQKIEEMVKRDFPSARILRMDADTTKQKDDYERILSGFANEEADILIGTQMIVKGHDFPKVTLVGIIAADLSLFAGDYKASENTFQLLAQAAGRAGRGGEKGEVIIQTYQPEHYSIVTAATEDYESFYEQEMAYRSLLQYPPVSNILAMVFSAPHEEKAAMAAEKTIKELNKNFKEDVLFMGPGPAELSKVKDIYRYIIYAKSADYRKLVAIKNYVEDNLVHEKCLPGCNVQYDFNPVHGY